METYEVTPNHNWTVPPNWKVQGGTTAERYPVAGDTVIFNDGATVTIDESATVVGITVNGAVELTATTAMTVTASDDGIVLTTVGASITTHNVTLSPLPTVSDPVNYRVRTTQSDGGTTYTAVEKVGTIFSVY